MHHAKTKGPNTVRVFVKCFLYCWFFLYFLFFYIHYLIHYLHWLKFFIFISLYNRTSCLNTQVCVYWLLGKLAWPWRCTRIILLMLHVLFFRIMRHYELQIVVTCTYPPTTAITRLQLLVEYLFVCWSLCWLLILTVYIFVE